MHTLDFTWTVKSDPNCTLTAQRMPRCLPKAYRKVPLPQTKPLGRLEMPSSAEEVAAVTWKPSSSIAGPPRRRIAEPRYRACTASALSRSATNPPQAFLVSRCAPFRAERIPLLPRVGARSDADADAGATFALTDEDVEVRGPPSPSPPSREWPPFPSPPPRAAKKVRGDLGERLPSPERLRQEVAAAARAYDDEMQPQPAAAPPPPPPPPPEPEPEHVPLTGEEYRQYVHNMAYAAAESAGLGAAARALDVMEIAVRQQRDPDTRGTLLAEGYAARLPASLMHTPDPGHGRVGDEIGTTGWRVREGDPSSAGAWLGAWAHGPKGVAY